jgi:hypothetical protein
VRVRLDLTPRGGAEIGLVERPFAVDVRPRIKGGLSCGPGWQLHGLIASRVTLDAISLHFGDTPVHGQPAFVRPVAGRVHIPDAQPVVTVTPDLVTVQLTTDAAVPGRFELAIAPRPTLAPGPFRCQVDVDLVTPAGNQLPGVQLPVTGTMQPEVRALPARLEFGPRRVGQTAEATVTLQAPAEEACSVDRIETESEDVRVEAVASTGVPPGRAFRVRQQITAEGNQSSVVRFYVRRAGGEPVPLTMEVCYHGDAAGTLSGAETEGTGP